MRIKKKIEQIIYCNKQKIDGIDSDGDNDPNTKTLESSDFIRFLKMITSI